MLLPLFPLPSRPTELIQFRQPNIADAMRFNSITPEEQEQQTTAYLKALLAEPAKHDPLTWTAQDRITALWWIFTGSRETPVETFTYTCKHCGKEHYYDCDMNALAEDIQVLEVEPFIDDIEVSVEGVPYQWRIVPLDGWAMEMLEMRRAALPPEDDAEFKEAIVDLRFWEFAYQCELYNDVTGTEKAEKYPYFEDMGFDSVIADEGHNYRNSYKNGREASQLAYLPTSAVAQSARDMAIKNAYLMKKNGGRGPVLLTATPVVNTPIDAYNMLSHVLPKEYWQKMGIYSPDDFVKFFGKTRLETVQKISGEVEEKMALVGFENLDALRGIFHRWTTLKTAEDVKDTVEIPELDEHQQDAPLTEEQLAAYEELRQQAEAAAKANNGVTTSVNEDGVIEHEKARPIFSIIRDMDRVCTDMDLYYRRITYRFLPEYADAVQQLADSLPKQATSEDDDSDDSITQQSQYSLIDKGEFIQLQVPEAFEQEVNKRLARFGIDEQTVTHPVTPKYAKLIATLKEFFPEGKQIIFTDEKTQHQKLKRIICNALNLEPSKVGILNAQTVAEAGKTGKKLKAVKPPKELPDEPTDAQIAKYNEQMALYDAYIAQQNEMSLGGLEKIAADFQEGRTPIIICNKKAEVGINLGL